MKSFGAVVGVALLMLVLSVVFSSWGTVSAGHRGVVLRMGAVTGEIKSEGFYTKLPWIEQVRDLDVRTQKEQVESEGASKDLQTVTANVALNFSLDPLKCATVYQTIGADYMPKVVAPAMQESIKSVVAQFTAEEMISRRELVREEMMRLISAKLSPLGIRIEALSIVNFTFSRSFNEAIEAKVTAEQNALAAKNLLAQKQYEAQQAIAIAKGKAEAMEIESAALAKNPQVLQLRALERWNGVLPMVTGNGAVPFLDVLDIPRPPTR